MAPHCFCAALFFFFLDILRLSDSYSWPPSYSCGGVNNGQERKIDGDQSVYAPGKHNPDDQADCPFCQAVSHGGIAVVPILVALLVIQSVIQSILQRPSERPSINHFGYAHRTRGPPTL